MTLQDLANLIHLRRYLYDIQNGYAALPKDSTKGLGQKIRELDLKIVKHALEHNLDEPVMFRSTDDDFNVSTKMIGQSIVKYGVTPEVLEAAQKTTASEDIVETKPAKKAAKKGSFQRSDD